MAETEAAAARDARFARNVDALRAAIPADIEAADIEVRTGSPWVPAADVKAFIKHVSGASVASAAWNGMAGLWSIDVPSTTAAATTRWGTARASVEELLRAALNAKALTIYDRMGDGTAVVNAAETQAAAEKIDQINQEWRRWIWSDDDRRARLARIYNDVFNNDRTPVFDGSHLTLPGKVGDDIIELRPHQKNFVWRVLQSGPTLADHTVGAGKTFSAIAAVMELRRTGQARKPMVVVPNHLVGQWAADFVRLYPGAMILAATKRDFERENRQRLFARMATGDWDAVVVAHSSFGKIAVDPNTEADFIERQIDDYEVSIEALKAEKGARRTVKQMEEARAKLSAKVKSLLDSGSKDVGITFDELGVDALVVDEAHEFKNLGFSTSMQRVAGLGDTKGSQKAADLYMKTQMVLDRTGGRNVVFLTGTPLSNTMAEMYTLQRYLDRDAVRAMGIAHFDAWARVFGEVVTDWELSPSGTYKLNSRFARFVNLPELMQRYQSFADVVTNDDIKRQLAALGKTLPLPKVKGGRPRNVIVERSRDQAAYIGEPNDAGNYLPGSLVFRAENLPKKPKKGDDNMLSIMSDARKAALDMRLIDPEYRDPPSGKVSVAAGEMVRIWRAWEAQRGTQLVFIDLSTPKGAKAGEKARILDLVKRAEDGDQDAQEKVDALTPDELMALDGDFSVYDDLKAKLISRGVPAGEIAFIHDANTEAQKEELFGKVRSGRVRFLFGSTPKMGAGTNVQNRLVALHHLDAPWRPSDLEQRDGRGIRQGNELYAADPEGFEIEILRYATEKTLDARQWQTIEGKARFIGQMRKGASGLRVVEDIAGEAANAAEMKAAASGNPLILEEMDLRQRIRKMEGARQNHDREQYRVRDLMRQMREQIAGLKRAAPLEAADAEMVATALKADPLATLNGAPLNKPSEIGAAILSAARARLKGEPGPLAGKIAGLDVDLDRTRNTSSFAVLLQGAGREDISIGDVEAADATGTGVRILNKIRAIPDRPELSAARLAELERQLPQMDAQVADWGGAADLAAARARHIEVIDALKPKPQARQQPTGQAKASADIADAGMRDIATLVSAIIAENSRNRDEVRAIVDEVVGLGAVAVDTPDVIDPARVDGEDVARSGLTRNWRLRGLFETGSSDGRGPLSSLISVAMAGSDAAGVAETTYHESWHALDTLGALSARDRRILARETEAMARALKARLPKHDTASMSADEVHAYAFGFYASDKRAGRAPGRGFPVAVRGVLARALAMISRIRNALAGLGYRTAQDVFDDARAGVFRASDGLGASLAVPMSARRGAIAPSPSDRVILSTSELPAGSLKQAQQWVRAVARQRLAGKTVRTTDGDAVEIPWQGIKHATAQATRESLAAALHIDDILSSAAKVRSDADQAGRDTIIAVHQYEASVAIDGRPGTARLYVREHIDGRRYYDHAVIMGDDGDVGISGDSRTSRASIQPATSPSMLEVTRGAPVRKASVARDDDTPQQRDRRFRADLRGWLTDRKPTALALLPLNYFTELKRPNMTAVDDYLLVKRDMDAYRGRKHDEADQIAQSWLRYTRLGVSEGGKSKGRELSDLMHKATLAGVDPSLDASAFEDGPPPAHAALRKRYLALSPKARELFTTVRDAYAAQADELDAVIMTNVHKSMEIAAKQAEKTYQDERRRIERDPSLSAEEKRRDLEQARADRAIAVTKSKWANKARLTKLRQAFEASRVPAPYFPLGRFGRYFVAVKDVDGSVLSFSRFERSADRDRAAVELRAEFGRSHPGSAVESGVLDNGNEVRQAMDPRVLAQIEQLLGKAGVDETVLDAIWQRYLQTMPDLSMRKRQIHRKGVAGFERDALRTFASHMFHAAHQMARLKHGLDLQEHLNEAADQAKLSDDQTRGQMLVNELRLRHEWVMNPTGSRIAQQVTSAMFLWYLAASPAAAIVNLSQTVMLGIPVLGARFGGVGKASAAIIKASKDFVAGRGDARRATLTADERAAMDAFSESGLVDRTQTHELAGVGDTGVQYSPLRAKVMSVIAWAFHKAEVMNREVTALAAYRLAREAGHDHRAAVNAAHDLTWKAHFDYANSSRARAMQSDTAKVLLVFQNYQLNMWYRLMRDLHQTFKGETPQARREARYQLAGIMGMMTLLAGVTGFAGYNVLMALAGLFFDDEDDPRDFKAEMEGHVLTLFGPDIGGMILKGVPGHLTRLDLTSRIGMPDFFLRMPDGNSEGRNWYRDLIVAALGVTGATIVNVGQGLHLVSQGNLMRGAELLTPKFIADHLRAYRFASEGVLNVSGDPIIERDRLDAWDIIARSSGFTSARIAEAYERNRRLRDAEREVLQERRALVNRWALARLSGDDEGRSEALAAIRKWNEKPYAKGLRITQDTLARSLQTRRLNARRRDDGVVIENRQLRRTLQGAMPDRINP